VVRTEANSPNFRISEMTATDLVGGLNNRHREAGPVVVVGASHGGGTLVSLLRQEKYEGDILLLGEGSYLPDHRPGALLMVTRYGVPNSGKPRLNNAVSCW
jgi:hypothetical protein